MATARTLLVMREYGCAHSPVWPRSPDRPPGPVDVADLGASSALRDDLAAWNERGGQEASDGVESFVLAASLQAELGEDWTVWCLAGGGDGGLRDPAFFHGVIGRYGPQRLLRAAGVVDWTPTGSSDALPALPSELQEAWARWSRSPQPSPLARRVDALLLAARLQASMTTGRVLWFGGEDVPG